jgi:hypothetical protein
MGAAQAPLDVGSLYADGRRDLAIASLGSIRCIRFRYPRRQRLPERTVHRQNALAASPLLVTDGGCPGWEQPRPDGPGRSRLAILEWNR